MSALLVLFAGCSGESFPETHAVTGMVTYQGRPVEGAAVILVPGDPKGRSAGGVTDAEGNFTVTTYFTPEHRPEGALPGDYVITVSKMEAQELPEGLSPLEEQQAFAKLGPPKSLLPQVYQDPKTSSFSVTIDDGSPEPLQLDLKN